MECIQNCRDVGTGGCVARGPYTKQVLYTELSFYFLASKWREAQSAINNLIDESICKLLLALRNCCCFFGNSI